MKNVIILPASRHYEQTIQYVLPLSRLKRFVARALFNELEAVSPNGVATWGLTPDQHKQKWLDLQPGDLAAFTGKGAAFAVNQVIGKEHNAKFAADVWGYDDQGRTWEYMIFLTKPQLLEPAVPYAKMAAAVGYASTWVAQAATLIRPPKSEALARVLGSTPQVLTSKIAPKPEADARVSDALDSLLELDADRVVNSRLEQQKIRTLLFGNAPLGRCDICASEFPKELLVAAHIKRRSACSNEEKRDHTQNILSLCKFGCDELFERGFIVVKNGRVADGPTVATTDVVVRRVSFLRGKSVAKFNKHSAEYFRWHLNNFARPS